MDMYHCISHLLDPQTNLNILNEVNQAKEDAKGDKFYEILFMHEFLGANAFPEQAYHETRGLGFQELNSEININ